VWFSVDRSLCFGLVYSFVHICVLFRFLFVFLIFGCGSLAHNEDIVRFRCGGES